MAIIEKYRVIRPSSRLASSPYKVDVSKVTAEDTLHLVITHESDSSFIREFSIPGTLLKGKKSIHFIWDGRDVVMK